MGRRAPMQENDSNVSSILVTSGLILLISLILAGVAYLSFTMGILDPPMTSHAPSRLGSSVTGTGVASPTGTPSDTPVDVEDDTADVQNIRFPGFVSFSITDGVDTVNLPNADSNAVAMVFTLSEPDGRTLYQSAPVKPGESDSWSVIGTYDPGTGKHDIVVQIDTYRLSDNQPMNGITSTFTVDLG